MSDDELKRLLQGLFSDEPIEVAPKEAPARSAGEAPPEEPPLAHPPRPAGRRKGSGTRRQKVTAGDAKARGDRSDG